MLKVIHVNQFILSCAMHSTSAEFLREKLNAYLAFKMIFGGQLMYKSMICPSQKNLGFMSPILGNGGAPATHNQAKLNRLRPIRVPAVHAPSEWHVSLMPSDSHLPMLPIFATGTEFGINSTTGKR